MYLTIKTNKQVHNILYIIYYTRTTCYGKYYSNGMDLFLVITKTKNESHKFIMSLSEIINEINL